MAAKFNVTGEQYFGITGQMLEIQRQIRLNSGSPIDPELVKIALQDIIEGKFKVQKTEERSPNLRLLSRNEELMIEALDGRTIITHAKKTFSVGIGSNFKNFGLNKPGEPTPEILLDVCEIITEGSKFSQIFMSLNHNLDKLVMTQAQIIRFCKKYCNWLSQGEESPTFFLIKNNHAYFVVFVRVHPDLSVGVRWLDDCTIWRTDDLARAVFPQLNSW